MSNENLKLWEQVEKTNPEHTKKVEFGARKFTTINAQHQIHTATTIWGSYGHKWGLENIDLKIVDNLDKGQQMAIGRAVFFYPVEAEKVSFVIGSSIMVQEFNSRYKSIMIDDEFLKKLETDILTKALSKLGFSADVFFGKHDDNRYLNDLRKEFEQDNTPPKAAPPTKRQQQKAVQASKKAIDKLFNMAKDGDFDRVQKNLHYYEETNIIINQKDKNDLLELVQTLSSTK